MKVTVDTNVLFSFFWAESFTRKILINSSLELITPAIALKELKKYATEIRKKTKTTEKEFEEQLKNLKKIVKFIDKEDYECFLNEAEKISPDKADSEFLALCIKNNCLLWSNDVILTNQNKVKVVPTADIVDVLF